MRQLAAPAGGSGERGMRRADLLEKTLMLGGIGGRRKRGEQRMRWLDVMVLKLHDKRFGKC